MAKKWQGEVWRFTIAGKSKRGNWWEGKFRFWWTARIMTKLMAIMCDWLTPKKIAVSDEYGTEIQDSPYGIRWGIKEL